MLLFICYYLEYAKEAGHVKNVKVTAVGALGPPRIPGASWNHPWRQIKKLAEAADRRLVPGL
jgi:hypothetical protein